MIHNVLNHYKLRIGLIMGFIGLLSIILIIFAFLLTQKPAPNRVAYEGELTSIDISAMPTDGPGVFKVDTNNQEIILHVDAGESACDREAIKIPNVKVGDQVRISGDRGDDGIVRVCESGTYIHPLSK